MSSIPLLAQVNDAFEDGDFTNNPVWVSSNLSGNGYDFQVNAGELQSSGPSATTSLSITTTAFTTISGFETTWQFKVRYSQAPSSTNKVEIFLLSDQADLNSDPQGYFIRLGEGGSGDGIDLFKTTSATAIISDPNPSIFEGINVHVRVTRTAAGEWLLEADATGGDTFNTIGTVTDTEFLSGTVFGFKVYHTSTRNFDYYFDDVVISQINTDNSAPTLTSLAVINETEILLTFDESLDPASAKNSANYALVGLANPITATLTAPNEVRLTFSAELANGDYTLEIFNVEDLKGNAIATLAQDFNVFFPDAPEFRDVLITEIMADPSPAVSLPDAEFVELFNKSSKTFDLEGWKFSDASTSVTLPTFILEPEAFVIICANANKPLFEPYGHVIGVSSLPSLNNTSDQISLKYVDNLLIDSVAYSNDWYAEEDKSDGGYSLELIDVNNICGGANNWKATSSETGGTPGEINSVNDPLAGAATPSIISISVMGDQQISVLMSEPLDSTSIEASNFQVDQGLIVNNVSLNNDTLFLSFESSIVPNTDYQLSIATISDCTGNTVGFNNETFQLFVNPEINYRDVIANEIMANPSEETSSPNVEFVELLNKSDKLINLKGWKFTDGSRTAVLPYYFLNPSEFVVLTPAGSQLLFDSEVPVIGLSAFPTLNNSGDTLQLLTDAETKVDSLAYSSSWYQSTTKDDGGFSLELIDENNTCSISTNWIASVDNSGATPGNTNSVRDIESGASLPELIAVTTQNDNELSIEFSEYIKPESIELGDFIIDPTIEISMISQEDNILTLQLSSNLTPNLNYTIAVSGVEDCTGNSISPVTEEFLLFENPNINYKEVAINEIMANPSIETDVANAEYIELFNNSGKTINLQNWKITDKSRTASLPYYLLESDEFVVLTDTQNEVEFSTLENVIGLEAFPTLNNSSDSLFLIDENGSTIDSLAYSASWYRSSIKDDGGYSLELIDPANFCAEDLNWIASEDETGGTPGRVNSVHSQMPDNMGPQLEAAYGLSSDSIQLTFNEILDKESVYNANYSLSDNLMVSEIVTVDIKTVYLILSDETPLISGKKYEVVVANLIDCPGNIINDQFNSADLFLIEEAAVGDVLVNEILFNPRPNGVDFVELVNTSNKYITIKNWAIANGDLENDSLVINTTRVISSEHKVMEPQSYLALTSDNIILKDQYPKAMETAFIEMTALPSFPNEEGLVAIINNKGVVHDYFAYSEDLHADIINDVDGVSLERISFEVSTQDDNNWMSAAASENFATPGYLNSHVRNINPALEGEITIEPKVIIPDGSGQRDFTTINYAFTQTGNVANVRVFDVQGREIKIIALNDFLSTEGFYTWDGSDNNGQRAKIGYYIVFFEVFNSSGEVNSFKEKVVIGSRF
ncbi:lamin tail domain-containing protein [Fulvivirga sp.]|uniref:lamin tail domain-containing protein n=1 Tax=Fulvivirga sp. TaxID=1931237 RepID=UPI0032EB45F5